LVTIKDVAIRAGVSASTVSHVINRTRYVSEESIKRVMEAIRELDYYPKFRFSSSKSTKNDKEIALNTEIIA